MILTMYNPLLGVPSSEEAYSYQHSRVRQRYRDVKGIVAQEREPDNPGFDLYTKLFWLRAH